jgi:hypothetical protein
MLDTVWSRCSRTGHIYERKILRRIFRPLQDKGQWRHRYIKELHDFLNKQNLSLYIKGKGKVLSRTGHEGPDGE